MTMKERLHQLIETLPEEEAGEVLQLAEEKVRQARPRISARGKFAHSRTSSEAYYRRKHEDRDREEEQSERRWEGG